VIAGGLGTDNLAIFPRWRCLWGTVVIKILNNNNHTDTLDDDDLFIVLTETKFSICYIPVWARYSPLRTRVKAHAITLSSHILALAVP
jgi:hypothetical protein